MKRIVMPLPVSEQVITDDTPMAERGGRGPLSVTALAAADVILNNHPEVKAAITLIWTPRGPEDTAVRFDPIHTCLSGERLDGIDNLKTFLDLAIPSLIALRIKIENDPEAFDR